MGYASYFEDITERRLVSLADRAPRTDERARAPAPVATASLTPHRPAAAIIVSANKPKAIVKRASADIARDLREIHVLCLAEMRPKAQPRHRSF